MKTQPDTLVDYTRARLHSKSYRGRKIERCPKCGKKGERTQYASGGEIFVHRVTKGMWAPTILSGDHCAIGQIA